MQKQDEYQKAAFVASDADLIGDVVLEEDSSIWFHAVLRGDHDRIYIGRGSNIQDGCILHADEGFPVEVGADVTVGHGAIVHGCKIGDGTLVGMGAIILNGAQIGRNCVIGAGTLVTQGTVVPDNMLVIGSPGKVKREVTETEIRENLKNTMDYVKLGREYREKEKR